jgi:L-cysteine desulfidase
MITDLGSPETPRGLRSYVPHFLAFGAIAVLFLGWVLSSGALQRQTAADAARSKAAKTAAQSLAFYGNGELKILAFYAEPSNTKAAKSGLVCYGVSNATAVTIEPALGEIWPSTSRCLEAAPAKDTEYKLVARDSAGHELVQTAVLRVER